MQYRWLTDDEIADLFNPACRREGWAELNINPEAPTCRVLGAFWDGVLVEAFALQLHPVLGPLLKIESAFNDGGSTARELADQMNDYLVEVKARGVLTICESPVSERLAIRHGMTKIQAPAYMWTERG